jgi:NitT/TauT family transport system substrate-binding protein
MDSHLKLLVLLMLMGCTGCGGATAPGGSTAAGVPSAPSRAPASAAPAGQPGAASPAAASSTPGTIKVAFAQPVAATAALWMAHDNGTFQRYGLKTDVVRIAPPADIQAMIGRDTQFGFGGTGYMGAMAAGANLVSLAVTTPIYLQTMWAQPSISRVSDVAGKSVAATTQGGPSDFALQTILKQEGVDKSKVNIVYLRDDNAIVAALESGQVQAAVVTSPNNLRVRAAGYKLIADLVPMRIHTVTQAIFTRRDWAEANRDTVLNFLKAYLENVRVDKTDMAAATAEIKKWTGIDDQALVEESYRTTLPGLAAYPINEDQDFQNIIDLTSDQNIKSKAPSFFYDNSYLNRLDGFVKGLYPDGVPALGS